MAMAKRYTPAMVDLLNKAMEYSKTKYPSMPDYARPKPSFKTIKKGTADIHAVWKGMHLSIEVKIGADRQSPEQKAIETDVKAAGGHYFIAKDFDTFYNWITTL